MNIRLFVAIALLCPVGTGIAQSLSPALTFEVATIKPRTGDRPSPGSSSPDRFSEPDTTLRELVEYAYDVTPLQVLGGPDWMTTRRLAIDAKATGSSTIFFVPFSPSTSTGTISSFQIPFSNAVKYFSCDCNCKCNKSNATSNRIFVCGRKRKNGNGKSAAGWL